MKPTPHPPWLRLLPATLQARLAGRADLHAIVHNIGWLFADKLLRMGVGLLVSVWIARYLGPQQFGLLSYAMTIVALLSSVATFGLGMVAVRDMVQSPHSSASTLSATFAIQAATGLATCGLAVASIFLMRPDDHLLQLATSIISITLVFKCSESARYYFESRVLSRYVVLVENSVFLLLAAIKLGLIFQQAPLIAFAWATMGESALAALCLIAVYLWHKGSWRLAPFEAARARTLLKASWPLMVSSLAIMLYIRIDQLMLGHMLGNEAVGIYSAAVRVSEIWYFIPTAIVASVFPSVIAARQTDEAQYYRRLQRLYRLLIGLALVVALLMTFASNWLIIRLFGPQYAAAGPVLAIHIWTGVFVAMGIVSNNWYVLENLQMLSLRRALFGALVNAGANLILIPQLGIQGAALSTLISIALSDYFFDLSTHRTRWLFRIKTHSLFFFTKSARTP